MLDADWLRNNRLYMLMMMMMMMMLMMLMRTERMML